MRPVDASSAVPGVPPWITPPLVAGLALVTGTVAIVDGLVLGLLDSGLSRAGHWRGIACEVVAALLAATMTWLALRRDIEPLVPVITYPVASVLAALLLPRLFEARALLGAEVLLGTGVVALLFGLSTLVIFRALHRIRRRPSADAVERVLVASAIWLSLTSLLALVPGLRWFPLSALALAILGLLWTIQRDVRRLLRLRTEPGAATRPYVLRLLLATSAAVVAMGLSALVVLR
jgi:hypothetical protein